MIKNNNVIYVIFTAALTSITYTVNASIDIDTQEARMDHLNNLSYQIKKTKLKMEQAELEKRCQASNGCLDTAAIVPIIKKPETKTNSTSAAIKRTPNSRHNNNILAGLSIVAIIDDSVVFKGVDGFFKAGDFLSPDVRIKSIKNLQVTLISTTGGNTETKKVIAIDWITD